MSDVQQAEESYQANTVVELKDELAARNLPTSGNKDELIARLEEDDAERAGPGTEVAVREEAEAEAAAEPLDYYPPRMYSPYELPANTAAAQAFVDANPTAVDPDLILDPPERHEAAIANIQDHVDTMAEAGVIVEDPRLTGGGDGGGPDPEPPAGPAITSLNPNSGVLDTLGTVTVIGTGFEAASTVEVDGTAQATTFTSDTQLEADYTPDAVGTVNFTVRNADDSESNDMPFTVADLPSE